MSKITEDLADLVSSRACRPAKQHIHEIYQILEAMLLCRTISNTFENLCLTKFDEVLDVGEITSLEHIDLGLHWPKTSNQELVAPKGFDGSVGVYCLHNS